MCDLLRIIVTKSLYFKIYRKISTNKKSIYPEMLIVRSINFELLFLLKVNINRPSVLEQFFLNNLTLYI